MDLHLIPGHFSDATERLLTRLADGGPQVRLRGRGDVDWSRDSVVALGHVGAGDGRHVDVTAHVMGSRALEGRVESFGAPSAGRVFVGLSLDSADPGAATIKDVEMGLLGLACAALASADQGVVALGGSLGPVGVGLPRGTVAEQVEALLEFHGPAVEVLVATASTAERMGEVPDFARSALGDLIEFRRIGDERVIHGDG